MLVNFWHVITTSILPCSYLVVNAVAIFYLCKAVLVAVSFCFAFVAGAVKTLLGDEK